MDRVVIHSDANCFYASVEMLYHPEFAGKPLAVGGDPEARHGIVLTANYIAKRQGVKTGMALWQARQVCPELIIVPPRMDLYLKFSSMLREIYSDYTDKIEPYGCDEAWLDVTNSISLKGDGRKVAEEISARVKKELGITVSEGISWNKIYAKLGSDHKKPDAITEFNRENYKNLIWKLPVSDLLYVGRSTNKTLAKYGIHTIGALADTDPDFLLRTFGKMGLVIHSFANGWDESPVAAQDYSAPIKSIGNGTTTPRDLENELDVQITFMALAESVSARLRKHGFKCNTVAISIRDNELYHFSRQIHLREPTDITDEIMKAAMELFRNNYDWSHPIRSLGIRGADLVTADIPVQMSLFICGDFGGVWHRETESKEETMILDWLDSRPFTTLFVCGNHENFDRLYQYPIENWHGGKVHKIRESVIHLMRGQVFKIAEKKIFCFGGASSHDIQGGVLEPDDPEFEKKYDTLTKGYLPFRINHWSWWKQELPSKEEMEEGRQNLEKHDNKVDFIVTHSCASSTQALLGNGFYSKDYLNDYLEEIRQKCKFKKWFFGHYHDNRNVNAEQILLWEQIIRIA